MTFPRGTIERGPFLKMTFAEFVDAYRRPQWGGSKANRIRSRFFVRLYDVEGSVDCYRIVDWYGLAFELRIRIADRSGRFGPGFGRWCFPWQWARLYYAVRFPSVPTP